MGTDVNTIESIRGDYKKAAGVKANFTGSTAESDKSVSRTVVATTGRKSIALYYSPQKPRERSTKTS